MTSSTRIESAMLMDRKPSSRNGETGRIISRMVPSRPKVSNRSPLRNRRARLDLGLAGLIGGKLRMGAKGHECRAKFAAPRSALSAGGLRMHRRRAAEGRDCERIRVHSHPY